MTEFSPLINEAIVGARQAVLGSSEEWRHKLQQLQLQSGLSLADRGGLCFMLTILNQDDLSLDELQSQADQAVDLMQTGGGPAQELNSAMAVSADVALKRGDVTHCLELCRDLLLRSNSNPDSFSPAGRHNFGLILSQLGAFELALENFEHAFLSQLEIGAHKLALSSCSKLAISLSRIGIGVEQSNASLAPAHQALCARLEQVLLDRERDADTSLKEISRAIRAHLALLQGDQDRASEIWGDLDVSAISPSQIWAKRYCATVAAEVHHHRGDYERAVSLIRISMESSNLVTKWAQLHGHISLSDVLRSMGDNQGAADALRIATRLAIETSTLLPRLLIGQLVEQAQVEQDRIDLVELAEAALVDPLSGLGNRRRMQAVVDRLASETERQAVAMLIDLDDLKAINDKFGHEVGDRIIVQTGQILEDVTQGNVFRLGGDEFVVIMDAVHAAGVDQRLLKAFEQAAWELPNPSQEITCSFGMSSGSTHDISDLVRVADKAMYAVKRQRRSGRDALSNV